MSGCSLGVRFGCASIARDLDWERGVRSVAVRNAEQRQAALQQFLEH